MSTVNTVSSVEPGEGILQVGLAAGEHLRWAAVDLTPVIEEARQRLDLSPWAAVALGRCSAAATLLWRLASQRAQRLAVEARGDGPMRSVMAEVDADGSMRGTVGAPRVCDQQASGCELRIGSLLGRGTLTVRRMDAGGSYQSQVSLVTGELGADIAHYLEQSEQRHSAVVLGVLTRPRGVTGAGGLIVEAMPGAPDGVLSRVEQNLVQVASISRLLEECGLLDVVASALAGLQPKTVEESPIRYACRCSREELRAALRTLPAADLYALFEAEDSCEAECAYCGATYVFARADVQPSAVN